MRRIYILLLFISSFLLSGNVHAATRSLYLGLSGDDVVLLQKVLIEKGYLSASATGYFGALTETAVRKFQCDKGIICSGSPVSGYGIAGPKTQAALGAVPSGVQNPSTISGASLTPRATGAFEISGWVPDWRAASATKDVLGHISLLKSIMPFAYGVSDDGKIIDHAHFSQDPWPGLIASARANKVRVIPTVMWGDGEAIHRILSNSTTRIALEDEIAALVKEYNFDGIDIDFEAKRHETIDYFSTFLKGLYQRMGQKWVYCTLEARMPIEDRYSPGANIPPDATNYANDYNAINKYCDRVELMAYDQGTVSVRLNAARTAPYAPIADPDWVENIVTLAAQSISRNKIIIGVPTYGYEYEVTPLGDADYKYRRLWAFNPGYAIDIATKLGINPTRTSANEMGFIYDPKKLAHVAPTGNNVTETQQETPTTTVAENAGAQASSQVNTAQMFNYMTWSDSVAIADKVELAHRLGVRGVAVFSLGGAEDQGMWNVLK